MRHIQRTNTIGSLSRSESGQPDAGSCLAVLAKFYFPRNLSNLRRRQPLWQSWHAPQLFDRLSRIAWEGTRSHQKTQEATNRDQCPIDRCDRLTTHTSHVFAEIGNVMNRHSRRIEPFTVGGREPVNELPQVGSDRFDRL